MAAPAQAVLSEHFHARLQGKRLHSAVFTTFRFEPDFFEAEVLPVFIHAGFSHVPEVRLAQLEDALRELPGHIAVYYDQRALVIGEQGARLDVARIPVRLDDGCFHPKNVLALIEDAQPDEQGLHRRSVLCACMSANLTKAGWWRNVEVAHVEEIAAGAHTRLRDPLIAWLERLKQQGGSRPHDAIDAVLDFLQQHTSQRTRRSENGRFFPHLHYGTTPVPAFIAEVTRGALKEWNLEVLSPYLDKGAACVPLKALIRAFRPNAMRVLLPCDDNGVAQCDEDFYRAAAQLHEGIWATMPRALVADGSSHNAKSRVVHAKVYRFFEPRRGGREVLYVGSANLTMAGCGTEQAERALRNWESGFLVEVETAPNSKPDWWLVADASEPVAFAPVEETAGVRSVDESRLQIVHSWSRHASSVYWNGDVDSPELELIGSGERALVRIAARSRAWMELDADVSLALEKSLERSSLVEVRQWGAANGCPVLVQEEDMAFKPSFVLNLSPAEILRYWAALTPEQRDALRESQILSVAGIEDPQAPRLPALQTDDTLFDRYAGIFHAFHCLQESIGKALQADRTRDADYRLFGKKYDSLRTLLEEVCRSFDAGTKDPVEPFIIVLCARQLLDQVQKHVPADPDYWVKRAPGLAELEALLARADDMRRAVRGDDPKMEAFLAWFEPLFLQPMSAAVEART